MELWKEVSGYDSYEVSSLGRVRSLDSEIVVSRGHQIYKRTCRGRMLKLDKDKHGYLRATFSKNGKMKHFLVHRLVANAFLEAHQGKECINHKDGNKENNIPSNLEWVTPSENNGHCRDVLGFHLQGPAKPVVRLSKDGHFKKYPSLSSVSMDGYDPSTVCKCCLGKSKTYRGFKWRYDTL